MCFAEVQQQQEQQQEAATAAKTVKVMFSIPFKTTWGQCLYVTGNASDLGAWVMEKSVPMKWSDGDVWRAHIEVPVDTAG